jgi:hypothetical protein
MNNTKAQNMYAQLRSDAVALNVVFNTPSLFSRQHDGETQIALRSKAGENEYSLQKYTYKALLADGVSAGDAVVVTVGSGELKLATVIEVLPILSLGGRDHKWILGRVDQNRALRLLEQENAFIRLVQERQAATLRAETLKKLVGSVDGLGPDLSKFDGMADVGRLLSAPAVPEDAEKQQ